MTVPRHCFRFLVSHDPKLVHVPVSVPFSIRSGADTDVPSVVFSKSEVVTEAKDSNAVGVPINSSLASMVTDIS